MTKPAQPQPKPQVVRPDFSQIDGALKNAGMLVQVPPPPAEKSK